MYRKSTHGFFICQIEVIVKILKSYSVLSLLFLHLNKQFRNQHFKTPFDRAMLNLKMLYRFSVCANPFLLSDLEKTVFFRGQGDNSAIDFWL